MSFLSQPVETVFIRPKRSIGTIAVQVVVSEVTNDTLTITKQPVQQGASITDHAYKEPTTFTHTIYFAAPGITGGTSLAQIYQQLLDLQASAQPFDIVTPKRIYHSMLISSLSQTTDKLTENCLAIHATYQQIIIVPVTVAVVPRTNQANPGSTGATQPTGKQSLLLQGTSALGIGGSGFSIPQSLQAPP
jgi:hypothetical protein